MKKGHFYILDYASHKYLVRSTGKTTGIMLASEEETISTIKSMNIKCSPSQLTFSVSTDYPHTLVSFTEPIPKKEIKKEALPLYMGWDQIYDYFSECIKEL